MSRRPGGRFSVFDGMITGKMLAIVPNRMIVQAWRAKHWKKTDLDSTLVLTFRQTKRGAQIDLVHVNVPDYDYKSVSNGWMRYYWNPGAYLAKEKGNRVGSERQFRLRLGGQRRQVCVRIFSLRIMG